jgi:hypothetical protein
MGNIPIWIANVMGGPLADGHIANNAFFAELYRVFRPRHKYWIKIARYNFDHVDE